MRTISGILALMLLAGCATAKPGPWIQRADGAWCQQNVPDCTQTGRPTPERRVFGADFWGALDNAITAGSEAAKALNNLK